MEWLTRKEKRVAEVTDKVLDAIEKAGHTVVTVQREFAVPYRGNLDVRVGQELRLATF